MKAGSVIITAVVMVAACGSVPESEETVTPRRAPEEPTREMVEEATREFRTARDGFLAWYYEAHPVRATVLGIDDHDNRLPPMERAAQQRRIDDTLDWLADLENIPFPHLRGDDRYDYAVMEYGLRANLLELEESRSWARDPRGYTRVIATGIASLMEPDGAISQERLASLRARMTAAPAVLEAARQNLSAPPRLWTELAIDETQALVRYLEADVPESLAEPRAALVAALADHRGWLESHLMPRSTGDFRLGRYLFERKLLYEEHIVLNATEMTRLNQSAIQEFREDLERVAAEVDPERTARAILDSVAASHPESDELVSTVERMVDALEDWVGRTDVFTLQSGGVPRVRGEVPPQAGGRLVFLDAPGPLAPEGGVAMLHVAAEPPEWASEDSDYLSHFNYADLVGIVIHHTFPGRLLQARYTRDVPGELRRVFPARSFVDGWAEYAEQVALDAGYTNGDPVARLAQIRRALEGHARWYATLQIHALDAEFDDVVAGYADIALVSETKARREVERATYDPMFMAGALGRLQIIELRKDYQAALTEAGEAFSLGAFHDRFLRLALPAPLARDVMIPMETSSGRNPR